MEAALFTLDVILLILLITGVRRADRSPDKGSANLGLLAYLEHKSDEVERGLGRRAGRRPDA